jgi:DNA-directed RNA polymerase subunit RPC12/RpoP
MSQRNRRRKEADMVRFRCPNCGQDQFTAAEQIATRCIYCGNKELWKMRTLDQRDDEKGDET